MWHAKWLTAFVLGIGLPAAAPDPFTEFDAVCRGTIDLWGQSACGPVLVVDPQTRAVTANAPDKRGVLVKDGAIWRGTLPAGVAIANTAVDWNDVRWTMVRNPLPADLTGRRVLLVHEAFHRLQPALGFVSHEADNAHLDTMAGRIWLRRELRALDAALAGGRGWRAAARAALAFRSERRRIAGADAAAAEDELERNEGLAEYTGARVGAGNRASDYVRQTLRSFPDRPSYVRSFAYATGPAYGLLLDRTAPGWRRGAREGASLGKLLVARIGAAPLPATAAYDGVAIVAAETQRAVMAAERERLYRARLVDGSVLRIDFVAMKIQFDPNRVFALVGEGSVYPALAITDSWGALTVTDGALLASDWSNVRVAGPAETTAEGLRGPGWTMTLAPGWRLADDRKRIERGPR